METSPFHFIVKTKSGQLTEKNIKSQKSISNANKHFVVIHPVHIY